MEFFPSWHQMANDILTVADLNSHIHSLFLTDPLLSFVKVKGELSNVKYHSSGHIYFTLKDAKSQISGVMFSSNRARGLKFKLTEGLSVIVSGEVSLFERDGKYQIYASSFLLDGQGELFERFEKLKADLKEQGLFNPEFKKAIPRYVKTLGVVTASTGAAVRDIINVSRRRFPYIQIVLFPAKVQGDGAAESVCQGIDALTAFGVDTIIVGRGGGSIEDLWAFNEEIVARCIFECPIPIISAVGHETDFTIADFVSDLRAPTPSAAAELAVFDYMSFINEVKAYQNSLDNLIRSKLTHEQNKLLLLKRHIKSLSPVAKLNENKLILDNLCDSLNETMKHKILTNRHRVEIAASKLRGVDPLLKLSQGYGVIECSGCLINDVDKVNPGSKLTVHVINGDIDAEVISIKKVDRDG